MYHCILASQRLSKLAKMPSRRAAWAGENLTIQAELPLPGCTTSAVSFFFCGTSDARRRSMDVSAEYTTVPLRLCERRGDFKKCCDFLTKVLGPLDHTYMQVTFQCFAKTSRSLSSCESFPRSAFLSALLYMRDDSITPTPMIDAARSRPAPHTAT